MSDIIEPQTMPQLSSEDNTSSKKDFLYDERLADPKEGGKLVAKIKEAVFDEYDRALLEGTVTKEQVVLSKKHVEAVVAIAKDAVRLLREKGIEITPEQERIIEIEAWAHDVLKIVPERESLSLSLSNDRSHDMATAMGLRRFGKATVELNELRAEENYDKVREEKLLATIAEAEELLPSVIDPTLKEFAIMDAESEKHSGNVSWLTRLLLHGEDSASWIDQQLEDLGYSKTLRDKVAHDIVTHMGMPYVKDQLEGAIAERYGYRKSELPSALAARNEGKVPVNKNIIIPELLDIAGRLPEPDTLEGAILFAADLLSPGELAGKDISTDPEAGCFDRYIHINLLMSQSWGLGRDLEYAVGSALESVDKNVERLQNPPLALQRGDAAHIEQMFGDTLGVKMKQKVHSFIDTINKGIVIDGKEYKGFASMNSWSTIPNSNYPNDRSHDTKNINTEDTMKMYYKAVDAYRKLP